MVSKTLPHLDFPRRRGVSQHYSPKNLLIARTDSELQPDPKVEPGDNKNTNIGYLQYNEYIVYDVAQVRLRYLLRVSM